MIKTTYQTPELRDANDNIVQQGAFGKNTALSNSTNDGWIDYVVNNLEALHDTIGDSAATLDGNGHVVEPCNLAIGDEDGNRLKTSYLKLTGGTVSGTLNVQQNLKFQDNQENVFGGVYVPSSSATEQYAQFYGGENTGVAGAKLTLYPDGDGRFKLDARSTDGGNTYTLVTDNSGNLNWRGYPLAWKKDYLPLTGGILSGYLQFSNTEGRIQNNRSEYDGFISIYGGGGYSTGGYLQAYGKNHASYAGMFRLFARDDANGTKELRGTPAGALTWNGNAIALSKDVLPLAGGTMTGSINAYTQFAKKDSDSSYLQMFGATSSDNGADIVLYGKSNSEEGAFRLRANNGTNKPILWGRPDGTLQWNGNDITPQILTSLNPDDTDVPNNAVTTLTTFTLTKGTWLVHIDATFQGNATGYRRIGIATSGTAIGMGRHWYASQQAVNGISTVMSLTTFITVTGASQTYYFNAQQTSGTQLTVGNGIQAFRVSSIV